MLAVRVELSAGREVVLPFARQLRLHIIGLGVHESHSLPRASRRDPAPALSPRIAPAAHADPRFLPAVLSGQLSLLPAPRRRLVRADRHRIAGRHWPEEPLLAAHAEAMADEADLSSTWPGMVMSLLRLALAVRDADGDTAVAEDVLDQIALPLKHAASQVLQRAGLLQPRRRSTPPRHPVRGCEDCDSWGITRRRCRSCQCWWDKPDRYPLGRCGRCGRDRLPIHRRESLCRGCLVFVRKFGRQIGQHTQLTFACGMAFQLSTKTTAPAAPSSRAPRPTRGDQACGRTDATPQPVSPHLINPDQHTLFTPDRDWKVLRGLTATQLPALTDRAAALLDEFTATAPRPTNGAAPLGTAVLRVLLAWLGAHAPFRERDVRAVAAQATSPATHRLLGFLQQRGLLEVDQPETPVHSTRRPRQTGVADLDAERRNRHLQTAIAAALNELPELMARHLNAWIRVLRGEGRRRHRPVDYLRIRRYLNIALPVLRSWATAGLDLRQIIDTHIRDELRKRQGSRARDLHHVLSTLFAALKQERLTFYNPMAGISLTTPVRVPVPLPSDRLRGLLDDVDDPRDRLVVALVAVHGLRPVEVTRLLLNDLDLTRLKINVSRGEHVHTIYLDTFTLNLITAWIAHRQRRWPNSPNQHLLITSQTAHHPARPPLSYCGLRAAFDKVGILPKQLWSDRVLHEAKHTADPVHLVRLFGIHPNTAVKYVNAAHPGKATPQN